MPVQSINVDCKISPAFLNVELVDSLSVLEPFGEANRSAVFCFDEFKTYFRNTYMGNGKHIRLECEKKGKALKFPNSDVLLMEFPFAAGEYIDVIVKASKNLYNGREYLSLQAADIKSGMENDDDKYFTCRKGRIRAFVLNKNTLKMFIQIERTARLFISFKAEKRLALWLLMSFILL